MESESACVDWFVSAQAESNDPTEMRITNARTSTFPNSMFSMFASNSRRDRWFLHLAAILPHIPVCNCTIPAKWIDRESADDQNVWPHARCPGGEQCETIVRILPQSLWCDQSLR